MIDQHSYFHIYMSTKSFILITLLYNQDEAMRPAKEKEILLLGNSFDFHWFYSLVPARLQGMLGSKENRIAALRPLEYYLMQRNIIFKKSWRKQSANNKCYWKTVRFLLSVTKWKADHLSSSRVNPITPLTLENNLEI